MVPKSIAAIFPVDDLKEVDDRDSIVGRHTPLSYRFATWFATWFPTWFATWFATWLPMVYQNVIADSYAK